MKSRLLVLLSVLSLCACDAATPTGDVPASGAAGQIEEGVADAVSGHGPKWTFDYAGDLQGSVQGGILAAAKLANTTTVTGAAMTADHSRANQAFMARITDGTHAQANLTLADGTRCTDVYRGMTGSTAELLDADSKSFHATLQGTMKCGDAKDRTITYTAVLKQ